MTDYGLSQPHIDRLLNGLADRDPNIKKAIETVGLPPERPKRPEGFETLLGAIVGQQVSVAAARAIYGRVEALMEGRPDPKQVPSLSDDALRAAGLSRQKLSYVRSLADALNSGALDLPALSHVDTEEAIKAITAVKGLGRWSAEMYLMFAVGRQDIWPVDDLGVQGGVARIMGLEERPKPKAMRVIGAPWSPARSAVALLAWHYYSNAPL